MIATNLELKESILSKLEKVTGPDSQGNYKALCPFHDDRNPSMSVNFEKGCYNCFACGSSGHIDRLAQRVGGGDITIGKACPPVRSSKNRIQKGPTPPLSADVGTVGGVDLESIAEAKHLPVDFLKGLGISNINYLGQPAIRIPYFGGDGSEPRIQFRLAMKGDNRFKWRKGDKAGVAPYGLNRLDEIRKAGWVLIGEGASDCWTCWYHGIPILGAPGKGIWPVSWGKYLAGLEVYVWQEPYAEDFTLRVLESFPGLRYITAPDGIKDISEAHIQGLDVTSWLEELKDKALSGQELKNRRDNEKLTQLYEAAKEVIESDDPLKIMEKTIRDLGYGGDIKPVLITYLAASTRLLEVRVGAMLVHLLVIGPSSVGKSYTISVVRRLIPPECFHVIDAGSPRALIYDESSLEHKVLIFGEADSLPAGEDNPAASAIRNLLQDHRLHYEVTVKDKVTGEYTTKKIDRAGPTVLLTTSTRSLGSQLMTRLFTLEIADSREQMVASLETQAELETGGVTSPDADIEAFQGYLQAKAPIKVVVPYARELARGMANIVAAPRINRDFARLLSLIKAVALIRSYHRKIDTEGRIIAEISDYETVRELVNDMYIDSSTGATDNIRDIVDAVISLNASRSTGQKITYSLLSRHLDITAKQAERRAKRALKMGWLVNQEQRKYHPADYAPGEPMPEVEGLPILEADIADIERVQDFSYEKQGSDRPIPITDGSQLPPPTDSLEV